MNDHELRLVSRLPVERWPEFRDLRLLALQTDPAAFGQTYDVAREYTDDIWIGRLRDIHVQAAWLVFSESAGRLTGMIGAFQSETDRDRRGATIWGVFVDPAFRGQGAGTRILGQLLEDLTSANLVSATLSVNREQEAAVRLYERHGFRIVGHETVVLGDGLSHDEYLMEALLNPRGR